MQNRGKPLRAPILILGATLLASGAPAAPAARAVATARAVAAPAGLILFNGRIRTEDPAQPWVEALAVRGARLAVVGTNDVALALRGPHTRLIDLHGDLVTPGFIDSHVHFLDGGMYLSNVPLREAARMRDVLDAVGRYAERHPGSGWIQGEGWSYGYPDLPRGEFHRELLDAVTAHRPVFLDSSMAHAAWVNSEALRRAGITRTTPDPPGGQIVRDEAGEPTGWLKEDAAIRLVQDKIPPPSPGAARAALRRAIRAANELGITRVDSADGDFAMLPALARLEREGALTVRISIADHVDAPALTADKLASLEAARKRHHGERLSCCVAKFFMDGVIESHTAYLPDGYADRPAETGMRFFEPDAFKASVLTLHRAGFQIYTHAIGDGAIRLTLDAYAAAQALVPRAARHRIEHAEAPDPADIPRFAALGVIASMQPLMIYPRDEWKGMEGLWERYAGPQRLPYAFALRSLMDAHAVVAFGTDWPVVQLNPLLGIRNAVLRQSLDGQPVDGYVPTQRITVEEALRAYTRDAAYASFAEQREGSLEPGKFADLARFSCNFLAEPAAAIAQARVTLTVVGGRIVYREPAARGRLNRTDCAAGSSVRDRGPSRRS
jgi:predicted amidohydrolase YtcJ